MNVLKKFPWWVRPAIPAMLLLLHLWVVLDGGGAERALLSNLLILAAALAAAFFMAEAGFHLRQSGWQHVRRTGSTWLLFALALLATALGDGLWLYYEQFLHANPFPSLADYFYLLFYPLFLFGILRYPFRDTNLGEWLKTSIDMVIVLLSAILVFWNFTLGPVLILSEGRPVLEKFLAMAYPTGDLVLLWGVLVILYRLPGRVRRTSVWLLAAGITVIILTDSLFVYQEITETYSSTGLVNLGYTAGYLLFAVAGIMRSRQEERAETQATQPFGGFAPDLRLLLPYAWSAAAFFVLVIGDELYVAMTTPQIITFVGAITTLVVMRQFIVLQENTRLASSLQNALNRVRFQAEVLVKTNQEMQVEIHERRRAEERLTYDALHDSLTGLPIRALFLDRLDQAARKRQRLHSYTFAVLFLDMDSFKVVNDSLGHNSGDQLLVHVARVLSSSLRVTDTVARLGGDEFVILLEDYGTVDNVLLTASRLQEELARPVDLDGMQVSMTVSIGIVANVAEYDRPEDVLRDADLAMYQAKTNGKARHAIFNSEMRASIQERLALETQMRQALECNQFILHYQPILSLPENELVGFEALVRWQHPERGLIDPSDFITVAEETGLIVPLGRWVIYTACRQAGEWRQRYPISSRFRLSVNVSGRQLAQPDFINTVSDALYLSDLPAKNLALEVTESVCLENFETLGETLAALGKMGVEIHIDDFGTGYSSLSYLQRLPIQSIKIDKSFVQAITASNSSPDIIRAILSMAHNLGIKAVAEGIETETQVAELNRLHCAFAQGYWFARPMVSAVAEEWLNANHRPAFKSILSPRP